MSGSDVPRPATRSQSQIVPGLLNVPTTSTNGRRTPARSPTRIDEQVASFFAHPDEAMATFTQDDIDRITQAAVQAALTAASKPRKPELPPFDKRNIEIWTKRVEAAYTRANITKAKDKFAYVEGLIDVNLNPRINEYLYGDSTDARWTEFIDYLHDEYGRTRQQQASVFLDGIKRDGRRPSQLLALIEDRAGDISLDELKKELVMRELPPTVRRSMAEKIKDLSAREAALAADDYFSKDGRILHSDSSSVNAIRGAPSQQAHLSSAMSNLHLDVPDLADTADEDDGDVNAVQSRGKQRPRFTPAFSTPQQRQPFNADRRANVPGSHNSSKGASRPNPPEHPQATPRPERSFTCKFHQLYGPDARSCQRGCNKAPKGQAGRRT